MHRARDAVVIIHPLASRVSSIRGNAELCVALALIISNVYCSRDDRLRTRFERAVECDGNRDRIDLMIPKERIDHCYGRANFSLKTRVVERTQIACLYEKKKEEKGRKKHIISPDRMLHVSQSNNPSQRHCIYLQRNRWAKRRCLRERRRDYARRRKREAKKKKGR